MLLEGTSAAVTGSTRGLGRAFAVALAREGANVVVDGRNPERCATLAEEINGLGGGKAVAFSESVGSYSHPSPKIRLLNEGGWTLELIRERVPALLAPELESIELKI